MPRPITHDDIDHQQKEDYPISVADRRERWERAENLHRLHPDAPDTLAPCLEVIIHRPSEDGIVIAAHRLLSMYEAGIPVISDGGLLFGQRLLPQELHHWDRIIQPGHAACLTDAWYNVVIPMVSSPSSQGTQDFTPAGADLLQRRDEMKDIMDRLDAVVLQGCHVILVLTGSPFLPPWQETIAAPLVLATTTGDPLTEWPVAQYITTEMKVEDFTGGEALLDRPPAHSYDRLTGEMLWDALHLTSVRDHQPDVGNR